MEQTELAELLFNAMNNERIERRCYGELAWDNLPAHHQVKYLNTADLANGYLRIKPNHTAFEGLE